jgi:hypothetical protein
MASGITRQLKQSLLTALPEMVLLHSIAFAGGGPPRGGIWRRIDLRIAQLVSHVIELFPQVNAWLRGKTVGPNISASE